MARILIVDDEPDTLDLLGRWLDLRGYDRLSARSGQEALRIASSDHPDLVLLNARMSTSNGLETCRQLREQTATRHLPVILISGDDAATGQIDALLSGATDVITQPIQLGDLGRRIHALLGAGLPLEERQQSLAEDVVQSVVLGLPADVAWLVGADRAGSAIVLGRASRQPLTFPDHSAFSVSPSNWLGDALATGIARFNVDVPDLTVAHDPLYEALRDNRIACASVIPVRAVSGSQGLLVIGSPYSLDIQSAAGQRTLAALILQARTALDVERLAAAPMTFSIPTPPSGSAPPSEQANVPITTLAFGREYAPDGEIDISSDLPLASAYDILDSAFDDEPEPARSSHSAVWPPAVIASLREAVQALQDSSSDGIVSRILGETLRSQKAEQVALALRANRESPSLVIRFALGEEAARLEGISIPIDGTLAGQALLSAELQAFDGAEPDGLVDALDDYLPAPLEHALAAPVVAHGEVAGALLALNRRDGGFDEQDADTLRAMAGLIGLAIDQARLNRDSQRRLREWNLLREVSAALATGSTETLLAGAARQLVSTLGADWCVMQRLLPDGDSLVTLSRAEAVSSESGQAAGHKGGAPDPLGQGGMRRAAIYGRLSLALRLDDARLTPEDLSALRGQATGSLMFVPLITGNRVVGLLTLVAGDARRVFTDSESLIVETVAGLVAGALDSRSPEASASLLKGPPDAVSLKPRRNNRTVPPIQGEPIRTAMASLADIARQAVSSLLPQAETASVTLEMLFADFLPRVSFDHDRMLTVFETLIDHAIRSSPPGGTVTVSVWDTGPTLQVEVTDRGGGISPVEQAKIWQRSAQADSGLGLVRQVVGQHHGSVWIESQPGEGSTFFFTLPKSPAAQTETDDFVPTF